jgi:hypothetical protein
MRERYVVDTNVLIAASAVVAERDATPKDPQLRMQVWEWLSAFQQSSKRLVLDGQGGIAREYANKLGFNDFGQQVVVHKWNTRQVDQVDVLYDDDGNGFLDEPLQTIAHDPSDRKMVGAALEAIRVFGEAVIANASDTDWYGWEAELSAAGVAVEQVLPEWSRAKYNEKRGT